MTPEEAAKAIHEAAQRGAYYPEDVKGQLTLHDGYRAQLQLLAWHLGAGERQAGWKIGFTADAVRSVYNADSPVFGYLLDRARRPSGHAFTFAELIRPALESELCFTLGSPLKGPGVTHAQVAEAVTHVAPAFEIIEARGDMAADLALGVADNVSQKAWVLGEAVAYPHDLELADVRATIRRNGETVSDVRGREAIDNQFQSIAWLANELAHFDRQITAGQLILSGSFNKPIPVAQGDRWETTFEGIGTVTCRFD